MKMLRNLSEELGAKFPATTLSYYKVKIACLDDAFSEIFELEASTLESQLLQQKDKKEEEGWAKKKLLKKPQKPKDIGHFLIHEPSRNFDLCTCPRENVIKRGASGKKGMLSCCKCLFE